MSKKKSVNKHKSESHNHKGKAHKKESVEINKSMLIGSIAVIAALVIAVVALVIVTMSGSEVTAPGSQDSSVAPKVGSSELNLVILNDQRCLECDTAPLISQLKSVFGEVSIEEVDYMSDEGQALYEEANIGVLPAVLFGSEITQDAGYAQVQAYLEPKGDYLSLRIGASFDPTAEICSDGVDNNGDGAIDCADSTCSSEWACTDNVDKPVVELFVMSHCPFGTQMEKGLLPVAKLLGDNIDFQLKFVNYAMHGQKEIDEQINQYCINKEYGVSKLNDYLMCFLNSTQGSASEGAACIEKVEVDSSVIATCYSETDEEFGLTADYNDKTKWKGQFPPFNIFESDNIKYGVRGSPHLVVNGKVPPAGRDSRSIMAAICSTFNEKPEACSTEFEGTTPSAGFGFGTATSNNLAQCG